MAGATTQTATKDKDAKQAKMKVTTPTFRVSFPSVFKPKAYEGQEAKYSITMLFPKATDLKDLKRAVFNAAVEMWGPKEKWPKGLRLPFRDGNDKPDLDGYKDTIFVSATSKQKPGVVDAQLNEILEDGDFYPGCYARATLNARGYDTKGNKGVTFYLQNIQKVKDGVSFSGRKKASEDFDSVDDVGDDDLGGLDAEADDGLGLD